MPNLSGIAAVILGIGFLIFVHELGHFLVAKLVGIRVLGFSIGFGPRVIGFRRGETDYRISLFPIGGYVKMAGESPDDAGIIDDGDFRAKTVGQRAAVLSAGVVMNAIFAFVLFAVAFSIGVPFEAPVIGNVQEGSPAWVSGLEPGTRIVSVNGNRVFGFLDISTEVAVANRSGGVEMKLERDGETFVKKIGIRRSEATGLFEVGIQPHRGALVAPPGSLAHERGLRDGDRFLEVDGQPVETPYDLRSALASVAVKDPGEAEPIRFVVERDGAPVSVSFEPDWTEEPIRRIGVGAAIRRVLALRTSPVVDATGLREGDHLVAIGERSIIERGDFREAVLASAGGGVPVPVRIRRESELLDLEWDLDSDAAAVIARDVALGPVTGRNVVNVTPGGAAAGAGLKSGDRIVALDGTEVDEFIEIVDFMNGYEGSGAIDVRVERDGESLAFEMRPQEVFLPIFALQFEQKRERVESEHLLEACSMGFARTIYMTKHVFVILQRMLVQRTVSTKNMGGIVMISVVSYQFAAEGLGKLLYFLGLLSVNLAILNLLPIPVLDGGQLVFLAIEKIKGSPVSERVQQWAALAGVAAILFLVLYVTYNDVERLLPMLRN